MDKDKVVCLFHKDCFDGMGAAWAVYKRFPKGQYLAVDYIDPFPEDLEGKHVVIVDFSYDLPVMREILKIAKHVTFLDHHERSEEICRALLAEEHPNLTAEYHADRSGATMAWHHFHPERSCPKILEHIADRDLWHFKLEGTETIMQGMGVYPLDLKAWDRVLSAVDHWDARQEYDFLFRLQTAGEILNMKNQTDIDRIIDQTLRYVNFGGFKQIPLINVPRYLASEALNKLAKEHPFAVGYYDSGHHRVFSLRSRKKGGENVNLIAERFGGGGHSFAAGFKVPRTHYAARM